MNDHCSPAMHEHLDPQLLWQQDPQIAALIHEEQVRQTRTLRLIPSENYTSRAVRLACASVLMNKYSEGYPGKRYYQGLGLIDRLEKLACQRARELFQAEHVNVQPYSGSPANMAVYFALLEPGDQFMGLQLSHGGHLTHGHHLNFSGRLFRNVSYGVDLATGLLDYDGMVRQARAVRPKLIYCGGSAYPRQIDFGPFREVADEIGAWLVVDMAHFAGLVAAGVHPNPVPIADVVTTTTHKALRGPRGAMILCRKALQKRIDRGVFPGLQGGPHNHVMAGIAVALQQAMQPAFKIYGQQIVANAKHLADALMRRGFHLVTGGTDTHLLLIDLRPQGVPGRVMAQALEQAGIITNFNTIPGDPAPPRNPNGIRLGTPAVTTRKMGATEMEFIAEQFAQVLSALDHPQRLAQIREAVYELTSHFPVLPEDVT